MTIVMKQLVSNSFFIEQDEDLGSSYNTGLNSSLLLSLLNPSNHLVISDQIATPLNMWIGLS